MNALWVPNLIIMLMILLFLKDYNRNVILLSLFYKGA